MFGTLRLFMMATNLFVIANVKQLRTQVVLEFYCLFPNFLWCWRPKFSNFKLIRMFEQEHNIFRSICNPVRLCQNFGISVGGGLNPPRYPTEWVHNYIGYNYMFRPYMLAIARLYFNLPGAIIQYVWDILGVGVGNPHPQNTPPNTVVPNIGYNYMFRPYMLAIARL